MTEQEKLQKAYFVLGLEPGAPLDKITRRHKRLIMVWHPDRFPTADGKKDAEEELKQINNAKDDLKSHFEKNHNPSGPCDCKPSPGASSQNADQGARTGGPGPGPGKRKTTQETNREEEEAQRRSREREARAAQEAAEKEQKRQAESRTTAPEQTAAQAAEQEKQLADERLRWKVSLCIGAAWLALSVFGWAGTSLKSWWHDFSWKWERDHAPQQQPAPQPQTNNNYAPPYQVSPSNSTPNTSPFGEVGPPPTNQTNSPYSTLDSLNKESSNSTQAPPPATTTPASSLSSPIFQPSTPSLFQGNQNSLRQNASDFLNSGSSRPSQINIPVTPNNSPITPSNGIGNSFSKTLEDINKKSGQ